LNCLNSIVSQSDDMGETVEVLVSDNFSTDDTWDRLTKYSFINPSINLKISRNKENLGAVENCKVLVRMSNGENLFWLTDDDFLLPGALKKIVAATQNENFDFRKFSLITYLEVSKKAYYYGCSKDLVCRDNMEDYIPFLEYSHILTGSLISKKIASEWLNLDSNNCYQSQVWCSLANQSHKFYATPVAIHLWENEIFWDKDVDTRSSKIQQAYLNNALIEAVSLGKGNFMNTKKSFMITKYLISRYGKISGQHSKNLPSISILNLLFARAIFIKNKVLNKFSSL